jgi:hypothetical protein
MNAPCQPHPQTSADIAAEYASKGFYVFPCRPADEEWVYPKTGEVKLAKEKAPFTKRGFKDASNDPDAVRRMFFSRQNALIGIDCGRSGIVAIDPDKPKRPGDPDGVAYFAQLCAANNYVGDDVPRTLTANGGQHWIYRAPSDVRFTNDAGLFGPHGVQVRGNGGYIIAPGSVMADGRRYVSDPTRPALLNALVEGALPTLPPFIAEHIKTKRRPAGAEKLHIAERPAGDLGAMSDRRKLYAATAVMREASDLAARRPGTDRSTALFAAAARAGSLAARGWVTRAECEGALLGAAQANCLVAEYGEAAVVDTFSRAFEKGMENPAPDPAERDQSARPQGPPRYARKIAVQSPGKPPKSVNVPFADDEWSRAEAFDLFPPPEEAAPYPADMLGPIEAAVLAIAGKRRVPVAMAAQSALAAAAVAAQNLANVQLPFGDSRPLSLYFLTLADSGDRKSGADEDATLGVKERISELREDYENALADYKADCAIYEAEFRRVQNDKDLSREEKKRRIKELGPEPRHPLKPEIIWNDITTEGLTKNWNTLRPGLGILSDEGGAFVGGHSMSDEAKRRTVGVLNRLWDGKGADRLRAGETASFPGRRLSVHIMVQPHLVTEYLSCPILTGSGFHARHLVAAPPSLKGSRLYSNCPAFDARAIEEFAKRITEMLRIDLPLKQGAHNELDPPNIVLTEDAAQLYRDFHDNIERQLSKDGALHPVKEFCAKAPEIAARLAAVLALFDNPHATAICDTEMARAIRLTEWYVGESLRMNAAAMIDPEQQAAAKLLAWLQARQGRDVPFREIMQGPRDFRDKRAAENALAILVEYGWVAEVEGAAHRTLRVRRVDGK